MNQSKLKNRALQRKKRHRRSVTLGLNNKLVSIRPLLESSDLITLVEPSIDGLELSSWIKSNSEFITSHLHVNGAIMFRGFNLKQDRDFVDVIGAFDFTPVGAENFEESTPREKVSDGVYTTTSFPSDQTIALHSDYTASINGASKICFFCHTPSLIGGQTPFADTRRVFRGLDKEVREKFERLGWRLVRNYGSGLGLSWQDTFYGKDKRAIERHCNDMSIDVSWNGEKMSTSQTRSAIYTHPITGEDCWFNHIAFWHIENLPESVRNTMLEAVGVEGLPFNTYYGDGSEIPAAVAHHIRDILFAEKKIFNWEKGDVLIADNILTCHGREPFKGERKVRVSLFDKFRRPEHDIKMVGVR